MINKVSRIILNVCWDVIITFVCLEGDDIFSDDIATEPIEYVDIDLSIAIGFLNIANENSPVIINPIYTYCMAGLSAEQIIALAPDHSSAKAGKELASPRKWLSLGRTEKAAWGECQGSAKEPYQTQIDLSEPAFKCTCPSRKFPCKHALGLFLLLASQPDSFTQSNPPTWVTEWLTKRAQAAEKPAQSKEKDDKTPDPAAQARRSAKREDRVRQGIADLDLWLCDLVRQGLGSVQAQPRAFWETPAVRLVDAQAPGLARKVREMAAIPGSGEGWQGRLLTQAGKLHLIIEGYQRLDQLPIPTQEDVRTQIGWTQDQVDLLKQDGVKDHWLVLGKRVEEEILGALGRSSFLMVQRTWLWGKETRRPALVLSFAAPGQMLDTSLIPGTSVSAEVVYYPGGFPLRALVKKQFSQPISELAFSGFADLVAAGRDFSAALAANPWLDLFPMALQNVIPFQTGESWGVRDVDGNFLPFAHGFPAVWSLVALAGGNPLDIFCEWNGETLWPVSVCASGRFVLLQTVKVED